MQPNFNPALGFLYRRDYERARLWGAYSHRPQGHPWMRRLVTFLSLERHDTYSTGELETASYWWRPIHIETHRGDQYSLSVQDTQEVLAEPFTVAGGTVIPAGEYEESGYELEAEWARERVLAPSMAFAKIGYYGGEQLTLTGSFDWRPSSRWYARVSYQYNDVVLPDSHFETRLIQVRANLAFNVKWSWVNLIQYDNLSESVGINSRLRWNPRAGEDLYVVWNHDFDALAAFFRHAFEAVGIRGEVQPYFSVLTQGQDDAADIQGTVRRYDRRLADDDLRGEHRPGRSDPKGDGHRPHRDASPGGRQAG